MAKPVRPLPPQPVAGQNCAHGAHPSNGWRWFSALGRWERICYTHSGRGAAMKRGDYVLDPSSVDRQDP